MRSRKANRPSATRQPRQHRRLDQPLEIDHRVVTRCAQLRDRRPRSAAASQPARIERDPPVEAVDEVEQLDVSRIDHPVDARLREMAPKRGRGGNAVDDVAEGAEADDEKARRGVQRVEPMRASRSRVE